MPLSRAFLVVAVALVAGASFLYNAPENQEQPSAPQISISDNRAAHILYGDHSGGGHKFGAGRPCKSEFPEKWTDQKIIGTVSRIAANDNLNWRQENNGYYVIENIVEGVNVRVVMAENRQNIITAYPINMPRNPCPANDN